MTFKDVAHICNLAIISIKIFFFCGYWHCICCSAVSSSPKMPRQKATYIAIYVVSVTSASLLSLFQGNVWRDTAANGKTKTFSSKHTYLLDTEWQWIYRRYYCKRKKDLTQTLDFMRCGCFSKTWSISVATSLLGVWPFTIQHATCRHEFFLHVGERPYSELGNTVLLSSIMAGYRLKFPKGCPDQM